MALPNIECARYLYPFHPNRTSQSTWCKVQYLSVWFEVTWAIVVGVVRCQLAPMVSNFHEVVTVSQYHRGTFCSCNISLDLCTRAGCCVYIACYWCILFSSNKFLKQIFVSCWFPNSNLPVGSDTVVQLQRPPLRLMVIWQKRSFGIMVGWHSSYLT